MKRVLIVKLGAIGDVVMAIPAAHEFHRSGYEIDWVCGVQVLPLLERYRWIHPIPVDDRALLRGTLVQRLGTMAKLWRNLSRRRYDLCATLYYDVRYQLLTLPVRAVRKVVLSHKDRLRMLLPGRHHTDEYLRVLEGRDLGPVPAALSPVRPESLPPSPLERMAGKARILLVPGGARNVMRSDGLRRWPSEDYAAAARSLLQQGFDVVLIGGPEDAWAAEPFTNMAVGNVIGRLTIVETLALMEASDVIVTHDTGPLHLAGITSVSIIALFGPTDPRGRLPRRSGAVALWGGEDFACRPCYDGSNYAPCRENACIRQITPEMVVSEIGRALSRRTEVPDAPGGMQGVSTIVARGGQ